MITICSQAVWVYRVYQPQGPREAHSERAGGHDRRGPGLHLRVHRQCRNHGQYME